MCCKWLICLEFSPHNQSCRWGAGQKTASPCSKQPRWKVDAHVGNAAKRRVPGTSQANCMTDKSTFCDTTTEIPCMQPNGLHADPAETKSFTGKPPMTTLTSLIFKCLQSLSSLLFGINQPVAPVYRMQAATLLVATTVLTPARSIHAPTLKNPFAS